MNISEVAKKYELSTDTLRYYEKIGLIPGVNRTAGGIRDYSEEDCRWVEFIKCMRSAGITVNVLTKYVALFQKGEETAAERKQLLLSERQALMERIAELQTTLDRLDQKIEHYEKIILPAENQLKRTAPEDLD